MKQATILHAIENKYNNKFEREAKTYVGSLINNNPEFFDSVDVLMVQPTNLDIEQSCIDFLNQNNIRFEKIVGENKQINLNLNYTNNVDAINAAKHLVNTPYLCWLDLDVVFVRAAVDFLRPTDSIVVSIFPLSSDSTPDLTYETADDIDTMYGMNYFYRVFFKEYLPEKYSLNELEYFINTWLTYGPTNSGFWEEWRDLTYMLLDIVAENHKDQIDRGLESICEEMAASILYQVGDYNMISAKDFFSDYPVAMQFTTDPDFDLTENCVLYHYIDMFDLYANGLTGDYNKDINEIFTRTYNRKFITHSQYLALMKNIKLS